jgi:hypothetical protein
MKVKTSIAMGTMEVGEGQTRNSGASGANSNEKIGSQGRIKKEKSTSISSPN